jgi:hypothetical protein
VISDCFVWDQMGSNGVRKTIASSLKLDGQTVLIGPQAVESMLNRLFANLTGARRLTRHGIGTYVRIFLAIYQNGSLQRYNARCCDDSASGSFA